MRDYIAPFLIGVGLVACMLATFHIGKGIGYDNGFAEGLIALPARTDTIFKVDTHFIEKPVEKWREKIKEYYVEVPAWDTVTVHDTVFLRMQAERVKYEGEEYRAVVTGVEPRLESIAVFPKTAYITNTVVQKKRWGFGFSVGPGVFYDGSIHGGIGVVAGLQYNF